MRHFANLSYNTSHFLPYQFSCPNTPARSSGSIVAYEYAQMTIHSTSEARTQPRECIRRMPSSSQAGKIHAFVTDMPYTRRLGRR